MVMHEVAVVYNDVQRYGIFLKYLVRWQIFFRVIGLVRITLLHGLDCLCSVGNGESVPIVVRTYSMFFRVYSVSG